MKLRLLSPISKRHRAKRTLLAQPYAIQDIIHQLVLTDDKKMLFVRNFKAGCSSVTHLLYEFSKGHVFAGNISDAPDFMRGVPYWPHIEPALSAPDVYRFTMVRHPQTRAVSAFRDFFIDGRNREAARYDGILGEFGASTEATIDEKFDAYLAFISYCLTENPEGTDPHFRRQVTNTAFGTMRYDRICRLETYADDMERVFAEAGAALPKSASLTKKKNVSQGAKVFAPSPAQQEEIRALYRADFEAFFYT